MNKLRRALTLIIPFAFQPMQAIAQSDSAGKGLRSLFLNTKAKELGFTSSNEYPNVYGVAIDWHIGNGAIATITSLQDGSASLYTTSTFGILGGVSHLAVRGSAKQLIQLAEKYYADAAPSITIDYPKGNKVKFNLLTHSGLRTIEVDQDAIFTGKNKYSMLFGAGQDVLTQLRLVTQKQ